MSRIAVVEIHKEELKFSAGHFMLLPHTRRETLHGHDYQLAVAFDTRIEEHGNGMRFDLRLYKQKLHALCGQLDYRFILPSTSDTLTLEETDTHWIAQHGDETLPFYKKDAVVLPICNVTLEELSYWFLQQLNVNVEQLNEHGIEKITVRVFNGRGESAASSWQLAI